MSVLEEREGRRWLLIYLGDSRRFLQHSRPTADYFRVLVWHDAMDLRRLKIFFPAHL